MSEPEEPGGRRSRGYQTPPVEHRFRKGVSGNPNGRPRKTRALVSTKVDGKPAVGFEDRVKAMAIEEAYRLVVVREGDRTERVPAIQAILRSVAVSAAKGNVRSQQLFVSLVSGAEADRRVATMELLKAAIDYKEYWGPILEQRARTGMTGPEPIPHPDDIIIDMATGAVTIDGPVLEGQKRAQDQLRERRIEFVGDLMELEMRLEADPTNPELRAMKKELKKVVDWLRADCLKHALRRGKLPCEDTGDQ